MTEFIFMLTHHDVTIPNALEVLEEVKDTGLRYIGCKDIGLNLDQYIELFTRMKNYGMETFLEVVTYSEEEHFKGVDLAFKIGVDNLIGGMPRYTKKTIEYIKRKGKDLKYYPYIGKISGHPCIQEGTIEETISNGKESINNGINGINLLLYRYTGDQSALLKAAIKELKIPLLAAGNVVNEHQIEELKSHNIWAFTIGGAVMEKKFLENASLREQIEVVLKKL